ncbi:hypothetical protein [Aeromonas caviae]|uniref:hypothetical protein n=1 Tax=Aeromonas caviae TaxID=648 RepID=UPI000A69A6AA|nr:hypothetical protein [Aeromonas caviae]
MESFSSDAGINVMVINVQAFNATGKDNRRIYEVLDDFQSRRPIDVISANRPILILDEPQKMEGWQDAGFAGEFQPLDGAALLRHPQDQPQQDPPARCARCLQPEAGEEDCGARYLGEGLAGTHAYLYLQAIEISNKKPPVAVVEFEQKALWCNIKRLPASSARATTCSIFPMSLSSTAMGSCL